MVALERRLQRQRIDDLQTLCRTESHCDRDCTIEIHDRRWRSCCQRVIQRRDASPIRLRRGTRSRMTGDNWRLQCIRAIRPTELFSALERRETTPDQDLIPAPAVLIEQQYGLPRRAG